MNLTCSSILLAIVMTASLMSQDGDIGKRAYTTLNDGWLFSLSDNSAHAAPSFNDSRWQEISLPHTWNAEDGFDKEGRYFRGVGWYRRELDIPRESTERRFYLYFEGANQVAEVYVNGRFAGKHIGGYTAFALDITELVTWGESNLLAVRVDNRHDQNIPPLNADFTFYGGIYRDVWLIETGSLHINVLDHASPGIYIDTPEISETSAVVRIRGSVTHPGNEVRDIEVIHKILGPGGEERAGLRRDIKAAPGTNTAFEHLTSEIQNPELWSPEDPTLFTVVTELRSKGILLDRVENTFGFRWFQLGEDKRFFLNGKPLKLIGTNRHQDRAGMGNALTDSYHRRDVEIVKETGFNFLRLAHYPQDKAVLEAADQLGLILWEEIPIVNIITMSSEFSEHSRRMLVEMIRQHYNHPSIAMWGYMNEVMLRKPDPVPPGYYEYLVGFAKDLEEDVKREDETRISVTALSFHEIDNGTGFGDITDVHGMNLYFGWYYQNLASWGTFLDSLQKARPDRVYMISEYGAGSDERVHTLYPRAFDFSSEYIQDFHMSAFPQLLEREYIIGTAVRNQFDFGSDFRQDTKKGINQKGLLFYDRTPKDIWYFYRAKLRDDPVLHIGREWLVRAGSRSGDECQPVRVFTNCDSVNLSLNGIFLASYRPANAFIEMEIPLEAGENRIEVRGWRRGAERRDVVTITYEDRTGLFAGLTAGSRIAVNAGAHYSYTDGAGVVWEWDNAFEESASWGFIGGKTGRTHRSIKGTDDDPLLQAYREGECSYRFSLPQGNYEIELGFSEPKFEERGRRVFDVLMNGENVLSGPDLVECYGRDRAVRLRRIVHVGERDGLKIEFKSKTGSPVVSSILIVRR